jgi:transposase-like protein
MTVTLGLIFVASLRKAWPRTFLAVRCLHCQSDQIVKHGQTARGPPRYLGQHTRCPKGRFRLAYDNRGCVPEVPPTMIDLRLNARGGRDTARSLPLCPNTVRRALQKKAAVREAVHTAVLRPLHRAEVAWDVERAGDAEAEVDAMRSCDTY